jgi:hypothetical protein
MFSDTAERTLAEADDRSLAETVAPEDLRVGDYVTFLNETYEYPSFLWCRDSEFRSPEELFRIQWRSSEGGKPFSVRAVCLPFVLLKDPKGKHRTVDIRGVQLVRLSRKYAKRTWSVMRRKKK